jgi:hypothetical protein
MPPQTRALSTSSVIAEKDLNVRVTPNGPGKVTLTMKPSGFFQFSQMPAIPNGERSFMAIACHHSQNSFPAKKKHFRRCVLSDLRGTGRELPLSSF